MVIAKDLNSPVYSACTECGNERVGRGEYEFVEPCRPTGACFKTYELRIESKQTKEPISRPEDLRAFLRDEMGNLPSERFVTILLNGRNAPIGWYTVSQGTQTASLVHPREVFQIAVREGACAVIVAHNHPSGNPAPSIEDRTITKRLAEAGALLGIKLLDHVIVSDSGFYSFIEGGPECLEA
jgi:DNA repair protein RadC